MRFLAWKGRPRRFASDALDFAGRERCRHHDRSKQLFVHTTYYFLMATVLCWAGTYLHAARDVLRRDRPSLGSKRIGRASSLRSR